MNKYFVIALKLLVFLLVSAPLFSQRTGFINSEMIRNKLPDAKLAEQRCQTVVDEWKRELKSMEDKEESLQFEIRKNRLIWSDTEKQKADKELKDLQNRRLSYATEKFSPSVDSEYDRLIMQIMGPVEEKIFAAVQEVAAKEKYDIIHDQSIQPLAYVNFRYDITLKVLKLLGVDVSVEEAEQQRKIESDARNDEDRRREASQAPRGRSRGTSREAPPARTEQNLNPDGVNENEQIQIRR